MAKKSFDIAKINKDDEFYTQLSDIEKELKHYNEYFRDKIVFCNCDDPFESNFFKYFAMNFNYLGLKRLIATGYSDSPIQGEQLSLNDVLGLYTEPTYIKEPYKIEINEVTDENKDGAVDLTDVEYLIKNKKNVLTILNRDGDFRSEESIKLLKESDIVVTNPPFSLFREFIAQLIQFNKKFIFIGNQNAITYKETFQLLKENKLWLGYYCGDMSFMVPQHYEPRETRFWIDENGQKWRSLGNICWYTNLDTKKRHEKITLYRKYSKAEYPKYDNYDAININKVADIPMDYDGYMGVPITFLDKYNPEQFEIKGIDRYVEDNPSYGKRFTINGKETYARIIIRRIER